MGRARSSSVRAMPVPSVEPHAFTAAPITPMPGSNRNNSKQAIYAMEADNVDVQKRETQPPLMRKDSTRPVGRHISTLTIKECILKKKQELFGNQEVFGMPTEQELNFLADQVAILDNDPAKFAADQSLRVSSLDMDSAVSISDRDRLEKAVFSAYFYCDRKEQLHLPLTTAEFQMKSVVDDVLVRILLKDTISATTGQVVTTLPAREPVVSRNTRNTNINKNLDSNTNTSTHTGANKDTSAGGSMQSGIQTPAVGVGVGAGGARKRRARSNSFRNSHHHEEVVGSPMFMPADTGSSEGQVYPIPAAMPAQITAISAKGVFEHQPPCALHVDTATSHSQDLS